MKDSLARYVAKPTSTDAQVKALGARAWIEHKILVLRVSQVEDPTIRAMAVAVAEHQFGGGS